MSFQKAYNSEEQMRKIRAVTTVKYIIVCLLAGLLAALLVGCTKVDYTGTIDPNAVEHNPEQSVNPLPGEKGSAGDAVGTETDTKQENEPSADGEPLPETTGSETGEADGNSENDGAGTDENQNNPQPGTNTGNEETAEPVETEYVVVLDPGHGGRFTGAVHGLVEKDTALKIALYAKEYLEKNYPQIEVKMTRETDKDFDAQLAKDLENRVQLGKELGADIFVSFHLNASVAHNIRGAEVICPHRENVKTESFLLGNCILDELTALGIKRRGIVTKNSNDTVDANGNPVEYYAINRHAANRDMIGIIVEHCFMDNEEDKIFLADEAALRRLGEADARGIASYFGY